MTAEAWRPIPGYEGWYEVSNEGNVHVEADQPDRPAPTT